MNASKRWLIIAGVVIMALDALVVIWASVVKHHWGSVLWSAGPIVLVVAGISALRRPTTTETRLTGPTFRHRGHAVVLLPGDCVTFEFDSDGHVAVGVRLANPDEAYGPELKALREVIG